MGWDYRFTDEDAVLGANPHGCNQHEHGEGCEKKSGQVNGKSLEQSERRKDGEDDKESNSGRGGDGSQGGIEDWLQFSGRSGAHHEQGGDEGSGRELGRRDALSEACRGVLEESARAGEGAQEDVRASDADRRRKVPVDVPGKGMCYTRDCRRHEQRNVKERFSEDDKEADRRADSRSEEERSGGDVARRGAVSGSEQGADSRDEGELGRRDALSERCRRIVEESTRAYEPDQATIDSMAYTSAAQLNAVVDGRKPAFFEAFEELMDGLAEAMPRELQEARRKGRRWRISAPGWRSGGRIRMLWRMCLRRMLSRVSLVCRRSRCLMRWRRRIRTVAISMVRVGRRLTMGWGASRGSL